MSSNIFATLGPDDLPDDFRLIAEVIGMESASVLIEKLAGLRFYIPSHKRLRAAIERYIHSHYRISSSGRSNAAELARELGVTSDFVRRVARPRSSSAQAR